jgi:hypothetical protein
MLRHIRNPRENEILARLRSTVEENKPSGKDADETDPYANDPFFKIIFDGQWNASVGRQGHEYRQTRARGELYRQGALRISSRPSSVVSTAAIGALSTRGCIVDIRGEELRRAPNCRSSCIAVPWFCRDC